uniref:polycystin family receptor for egg jelly-like n=1 Tax=Myxine glutinosa TaxID=7769 RepID=UPI00358F214D
MPPSHLRVYQCFSLCSKITSVDFTYQRNDVKSFRFHYDDIKKNVVVFINDHERASHQLGQYYLKNIQITGFEKEKFTYSQHEYQNAFSTGCICIVESVPELAPRVCLDLSTNNAIVFQMMNWCSNPWTLYTNQHLCWSFGTYCTLYDLGTNALRIQNLAEDDFEFLAGRLHHVNTKLCLHENGHMGNCTSAAILEVIPGYMQTTGLENFLPDEKMKSTSAVIGFEAQQARLNNPFSHWIPENTEKSEIKVYFGMLIEVTGICMQGSAPLSQTTPSWVKRFDISWLSASHVWSTSTHKLGNINANETVQHLFSKIHPSLAIKLFVFTWQNTVALRLEVLSIGLYHNNFSLEYDQLNTEGMTTIQMFGIYQGLTCCLCEPEEGYFFIFGPSYCSIKFSMPNITSLPFLVNSAQENYIALNHLYSQYNVHTVRLKQLTPQSDNTSSGQVSVNSDGCRIINIYVDETGNITRSEELLLFANIEIVCLKENENYGYKWNTYDLNGEQYKTLAQAAGPRAFFPATYFDVGVYIISVNISYFHLEVKSEQKYLTVHVSPSPLVVIIKGGLERIIGNVADAVVDAGSLSYDPDLGETSEGMTFTCTCEDVGQTFNCIGQANGMFLLPSNNLVAGAILRVVVVGSKDGRETNYTQILNVITGDPPDISVRCLDNCGNYASSGSTMILMVDCWNCLSEEMSYSWELKERKTSLSTLNQFTETGINTQGLVILPGLLKPSETYETHVTVGSSLRPLASSVLHFKTNIVPFGGTCKWSPSEGVAGFTTFQVICSNWTLVNESTDSPAIYITKANNHEREFLLYINTVVLTTHLILPFGDPSLDHLLNVSIVVCNVYHDCTESPSTVQVLPLKPDEYNMTKEFEEGGKLWSTVMHNPNMAIEYVQVYASLLGSFRYDVSQFVVQNLINALHQLVLFVNTPMDCLQYAQALEFVVQMSPQPLPLTDVISDCMLLLVNKVKTMKSIDKAMTLKISDALTVVGGSLMEGIMTAPVPVEPDPINNQKSEELFGDVFTNMKKCGASVVKKLVPGGKASVATNNVLTLTREVVHLKNLHNKTWNTSYCDTKFIQSLNESKSAKGNTGLQVMSFKGSPFTWIQGVNSNNPVVSMLLYDKTDSAFAGIQIQTKETTTKRFLGERRSIIRQNCTFPICKNVIKFNITLNGTVAFFDLVPLSMLSWLEMYISWNRIVIDRRSPYDCGLKMNTTFGQLEMLNCSLMRNNSQAQNFPIKLDNLMPGQYCITIMYPGSNGTTIMFASFLMASCMLKNPNRNQWMHNMGDIHPDSTRDNVICNFNSRFIDFPPDIDTPWFMITDIFVPPNTIDFLTVFGKFDLANNGAVFGSVIAIILLSLIAGLWARSADLRDRRKWKVLPIKGMDLTNEYYYCVIVSTGMMPKAGTTSTIYFRINFQYHSTDCLELDNGYNKGFDKGSVQAFILPLHTFPGKPLQLQIWHDSSGQGSNRNWFLNEILLRDVQTKEMKKEAERQEEGVATSPNHQGGA